MISMSLFGALVLAALLVFAILLGRGRDPSVSRVQGVVWPVAAGLAFFVGAVVYSGRPRWPLPENEDRFLALLVPLATLIESLAFFSKSWLAWTGRLLVAGAAVPVLLFGSMYFDTWTTQERWFWLTGLPVVLLVGWISLDLQIRHLPPRTVLFGLAGVNAGAGVVLMIAGYATGGPLGLILGTVLAGVVLFTPRTLPASAVFGAASIGLVGLFALLISGHFFASLGLDHAAILFAAPLLAWTLLLPRIRKTALLRLAVLALEATPVLGVAGLAWIRSETPPPEPPRTTIENGNDYSPSDYEQFKGPNKK